MSENTIHHTAPIRVGITQGDTNAVGYELIFKTFSDPLMFDLCTPIIYGHASVAQQHRKALRTEAPIYVIQTAEQAMSGRLNLVNLGDTDIPVTFGQPSPQAAQAAFEALQQATTDLKLQLIDTVVTTPINKHTIQQTHFQAVGHTEYFQQHFGEEEEPLMILFNEHMRVALLTTHLPVSEIAYAVTQERIEQKARLLHETLKRDFGLTSPRIAVLSLNPHAGDGGTLGHEEEEIIIPAIKVLSDAGMPLYGPYAADGFFGAGSYKHFDAVLAMYHDQGLAPFKALSFGGGVNYTAGLSIIRTSPDHGTAYDIAGKGIASPDSFRQAVYAAVDIYRNRISYDEANANPLPKLYKDKKEK